MIELRRPVDPRWRLSQPFRAAAHPGIDFACPVGSLVLAAHDGVVKWINEDAEGVYGLAVHVESGEYVSIYGHLESVCVKTGQQVFAGQPIGLSGNTGDSSGPHLHFEVRRMGAIVDPTHALGIVTKRNRKEVRRMEKGQGLVEYALILVLVAIVVIAILALLGPAIGNVFTTIMTAI